MALRDRAHDLSIKRNRAYEYGDKYPVIVAAKKCLLMYKNGASVDYAIKFVDTDFYVNPVHVREYLNRLIINYEHHKAQRRNDAIKKLRRRGWKVQSLADKFNLSTQMIYKICAKP